MTDEEQFKMGIELGHEAYRDGITGNELEQAIETIKAVQGHTVMAMRMQNDPKYKEMMNNLIVNDGNLVNDIIAFKNGDMVNHVLGNYDTSADYWKLVEREDGSYGIEFDGLHSLVDGDDNVLIASDMDELVDGELRSKGGGSFSGSLAEILGMHPDYNATGKKNDAGIRSDDEIGILLEKSGATWSDINNRYEFADGRSVDANPHLMTRLAIEEGEFRIQENADGSSTVTFSLRDESNNSYDKTVNVPAGETYTLMMEDMIDSVMGGTTYAIDKDGITIYPQSSTLADSDKVGTNWDDPRGEKYDHIISNISPGIYQTITDLSKGKFVLRLQGESGGQDNLPGFREENGKTEFNLINLINLHVANKLFVNKDGFTDRGSSGCVTMGSEFYNQFIEDVYGTTVGINTTVEISSLDRERALANERQARERAQSQAWFDAYLRQEQQLQEARERQRREESLRKWRNPWD